MFSNTYKASDISLDDSDKLPQELKTEWDELSRRCGKEAAQVALQVFQKSLEPPSEVKTYFDGKVLTNLLGRGGMAEIYRHSQDSNLAIKIAKRGSANGGYLEREFKMLKQISHAGVVKVHNFSSELQPDRAVLPCFTMELIRGQTLDRVNLLSSDQLYGIAMQLALALAAVHKCRILHHDVKPLNVLWNADTGQIKLIDFGVSWQFNEATRPTIAQGSYGPPNWTWTVSDDIYSFGRTIEYLMSRVVREDPASLQALNDVCKRCTHAIAASRMQTMAEVIRWLETRESSGDATKLFQIESHMRENSRLLRVMLIFSLVLSLFQAIGLLMTWNLMETVQQTQNRVLRDGSSIAPQVETTHTPP